MSALSQVTPTPVAASAPTEAGSPMATLQAQNPMRVGVVLGLPFCGRGVTPSWAMAFRMLDFPTNVSVVYYPILGKPVAEAREEVCEEALKQNARFVAFLDDDVIPPFNWIRRLMAILDQFPEAAVAAGIYPTKSEPPEPVVYAEECGGPFWQWKRGEIFACALIGTGCMLIRTDILRSLPRPWFRTVDDATNPSTEQIGGIPVCKNLISDDVYFCRLVTAAGKQILADGGIICGHADIASGRVYELPPESYPLRDERVARAMLIPGWMRMRELTQLANWAREHKLIVEVGSHRGRSTRALADNTFGQVIAFDDWTGTRDTAPHQPAGSVPEDYAAAFRFNLRDLLDRGRVLMVQAPHSEPERVTDVIPDRPDMVFLDGSHEYADVRRDILYWMDRLADGGLLCGHDADWTGVQQALDELLPGSVHVVEGTSLWFAQSDLAKESKKSKESQ